MHSYHSGDSINLTKPGIIFKLLQSPTGTFLKVTQWFTNGTAQMLCAGAIIEMVNISQLNLSLPEMCIKLAL
jgi:hypothetical protein